MWSFLKRAKMSSIMLNEAARCLRRSLWQFSRLPFVRYCSYKRKMSPDGASVKLYSTVKSEKVSKSNKSHKPDFNKSELDVKGNAKRLTEFPESFQEPAADRMVKRPGINLSTGTSGRQNHANFTQRFQNSSKVTSAQSNSKPCHVHNSEFQNLRDDDFIKQKLPKTSQPFVREAGSEMLFGMVPCSLALSQLRRKIFKLFVKENRTHRTEMQGIYQRARETGVPVHQVMRKVLDRLCEGRVHQGICLEVTPLDYVNYDQCCSATIDVSELEDSNKPVLWLALEGIQDPMNMGALLRSAYFLGADLVLLPSNTNCEQSQCWSCRSYDSLLHSQLAPSAKGNEGFGLSDDVSSLCHTMLTIPGGRDLQAGIESLNVSVAAGILLHCITSKRMKG
ncbi:rRNA methyltransferase 1, mitochondrial isoform X2 [Pristis pectinata]|uniref:rRNA methyltransferase 1, mitochondrial isoform X2 n=1 Tax=Pristis pectinata TaxID=685728 RepID=UPI00223D3B1A|nr:rRNA methyltransferase 1, mitochondrial isoform X2 [Pristis pectinata]